MASSPRTAAPERPPPPVPQPQPPFPTLPSPPRNETEPPQQETTTPTPGTAPAAPAASPPLSPLRFTSHLRSLPPSSSPWNGQEHVAAQGPRRPLRLATGLVRTPSHASLKSPSPSPSPSPSQRPPLALTPTHNNNGQSTPNHVDPTKPRAAPAVLAIASEFDPVEEAITSPLRTGKARLDQQRAPAPAGNGGVTATVPRGVQGLAVREEARTASVALRVAAAVLSLVAFALMASDRTSGWDGDHYGRYQEYRYAVGVNVIVCIYSVWQAFSEIRSMVSSRFLLRTTSSYFFSLVLDQILAYLLMSASSAAASRNDLWVSRFGKDAFTRKINSSVWVSFFGFLALAASSLISTANLFNMVS